MSYEVVVVGGGIGGLTTAALLAARGLSVCLLERESRAGGCAGSVESFGYRFEMGAGLYASWQPGEVHERVFAELPVAAPEARAVSPAYVVRLPEGRDVRVGQGAGFEDELRAAFPECAAAAVEFYRGLAPVAEALHRAARAAPALATLSGLGRLKVIASEPRLAPRILACVNHTAARHLEKTSARFRRFVDAQLEIFAQTPADRCAYLYAAVALSQPRRGMYALRGGGAALAGALVESIRLSGGAVRLGATALRLALDAGGRATGVELLGGEVVAARRAVVSNLTVWDTYGKLVGLNRTPAGVRARLKQLRGRGAYQIYLGAEEAAAGALPAEHILALVDREEAGGTEPPCPQFMLSAAPVWDARAPAGRRALTVSTFTGAEEWFAFHEDESAHEAQDRGALEKWWGHIHAAVPELGGRVELIETATPRTFYEQTRRRLGMVGGVGQSLGVSGPQAPTHRTPFPNLYLTGDTVFPGNGVAAVTQSALIVANEIAPPTRAGRRGAGLPSVG